jgi:hypothetical protein
MQEFNPDCTINLCLESQGHPAKIAWCCSVVNDSNFRVIVASRFLGKASFENSLMAVLKFGLEQALRLRVEKLHLATDLPVDDLFNEKKSGRSRYPKLQSEIEACNFMWNSFRLKKRVSVSTQERSFLRAEAEKFFKRGVRG